MPSARQIVVVAQNALVETVRAPIFAVVLVCAVLLAGAIPALDYLSFLAKRRLVADSLLALTICAGSFAAAVSAVSVIGDDLRRGSAVLVLSKPLSRASFVAGKLLGLSAGVTGLWVVLGTAVLWGSRVAVHDYWPDRLATRAYFAVVLAALLVSAAANYRGGRPFAATLVGTLALAMPIALLVLSLRGYRGHGWGGWGLVDWRQVAPVVLTLPAMLLTASVAATAAIRLDAAPALLVTAAVFMLGLTVDYLLGSSAYAAVRPWAVLFCNWQPFWVSDAMATGPVPWGYVVRATLSGALQAAAVGVVGFLLLDRQELG